MLLQKHVKDSGQSAKSAGGRLYQNPHTPLTKGSRGGLTILSRHSVGIFQGYELTRKWSGNTRPESSQFAGPLWTDPSLKSGIGTRELISTYKRKKAQAGNEMVLNLSPKSSLARRKLPVQPTTASDVYHM